MIDIVYGMYTNDALLDKVDSIPGIRDDEFLKLSSNQFSGYLPIQSNDQKYIFYYYIESQRNPQTDSLLFWTNGGPGCSGLLGFFTEMGPWRPIDNTTMVYNPFTWTQFASIVFLEQPAGVGFSFTSQNNSDYIYTDYQSAVDNQLLLESFFIRYPERKPNPFYLTSESYGGHYIPQWTLQIFKTSTTLLPNFKGVLIGNPFTSFASGPIAMANALWGLQLIPKPIWQTFTRHHCQHLNFNAYIYPPICWTLLDQINDIVTLLNPYALEYPVCEDLTQNKKVASFWSSLLNAQSQSLKRMIRKIHDVIQSKEEKNPAGRDTTERNTSRTERLHYNPCTESFMTNILNREDIQKALHVIPGPEGMGSRTRRQWDPCNDPVNGNWSLTDVISDVTNLYSVMMNHPKKPTDFRMLIFSGDADGVCATIGTQHWVYNIQKFFINELYQPWNYVDTQYGIQQGGYQTIFNQDAMVFATVHHAGHEVPAYQPEPVYHLVQQFLYS